MKILQKAKNGIITLQEKSFEELTSEEKIELKFSKDQTKENYKNYRVYRNKKNEILRVEPYEFTETYSKELREYYKKPNMVDVCNIIFANQNTKNYKKSKKKFTNEQINFLKNYLMGM